MVIPSQFILLFIYILLYRIWKERCLALETNNFNESSIIVVGLLRAIVWASFTAFNDSLFKQISKELYFFIIYPTAVLYLVSVCAKTEPLCLIKN